MEETHEGSRTFPFVDDRVSPPVYIISVTTHASTQYASIMLSNLLPMRLAKKNIFVATGRGTPNDHETLLQAITRRH